MSAHLLKISSEALIYHNSVNSPIVKISPPFSRRDLVVSFSRVSRGSSARQTAATNVLLLKFLSDSLLLMNDKKTMFLLKSLRMCRFFCIFAPEKLVSMYPRG